MRMHHKRCGFILISALFFLFLLNLIVLQALEINLLQSKISRVWQQQQNLLALAESGLAIGEKTLADYQADHLRVTVKLLQTVSCAASDKEAIEIRYYQINAIAGNNASDVKLESTYARFPPAVSDCQMITSGRQSWRQL